MHIEYKTYGDMVMIFKGLSKRLNQQIRGIIKFFSLCSLAIISISCSGGGSSGNSGNGGNNPTPTPITQVQQVNISNISAIPVTGNQTSTSLIVTNDTTLHLNLTSAVVSYGSQSATLNLNATNDTFAGAVNVTQCGTLQAKGT
jgi:hypothetical protein